METLAAPARGAVLGWKANGIVGASAGFMGGLVAGGTLTNMAEQYVYWSDHPNMIKHRMSPLQYQAAVALGKQMKRFGYKGVNHPLGTLNIPKYGTVDLNAKQDNDEVLVNTYNPESGITTAYY